MIGNYGEQRLHKLGMPTCHSWQGNVVKYRWVSLIKTVGATSQQSAHN